ncbi:DNA-binding MarR family transcriptional regulator [Sinorhizobium kostiense]|uniref:DNA-binding MarR family transcriptional regulator n=1 Tax=Sinorhizobium kostiense TaxID=76747 RepID=A0ABS4QSU6_9HYPH|nr:MarR family transcriptional regulator [Sinorhizobium kostiense]MBP2233735.1 DNA-binding MarR family transcriptional regulator [Sinorhizobium kostiense]
MEPDDRLLRQFVGYNMKRAFIPVQEDVSETLATLGLRVGTFSALAVIMASPGISQTQLSQVLNIKRSGVVLVVDELEGMGAVERMPVESDRRAYALQVTPEGRKLWQRAESAVQAHEAALFADLAPEELRVLRGLLDRAARSGARRRRGEKQ